MNHHHTLILFDVDKTLSESRCKMTEKMKNWLIALKNKGYTIGIVGGSDFEKQKEQLGDDIRDFFEYTFSENGLVAYHWNKPILYHSTVEYPQLTIQKFLRDTFLTEFIDYVLESLSKIKLPFKRGVFIEMRNGMINICPCGRSVTSEERKLFETFDKEHDVRKTLVKILELKFGKTLKFSIGGTISIDAFPHGWDKTFCLQFVEYQFEKIHFFGDQTQLGGNDYEIYHDKRVIGHQVKNPEDTMNQIQSLFFHE